MPPNINSWNFCKKRFDFGVPLEDVFPPNDVHPRLKYLFEEAYRVSLESGLTIDQILRQYQGPLEVRLKLKARIINDLHYHIKRGNIDESPGAYFWAIRHFLGLLPIPVLPEYARETWFDWYQLSEKCHKVLCHYETERRKISLLDYEIAENLNLLPFEHFLLLFILVVFIRKLSLKTICRRQISRRTLLILARYYCSAISSRPYRPGHYNMNDKMFPLFFYLLLRWRYIEKNCRKIGHPAYFLEMDCLDINAYQRTGTKDCCVQTTNCLPEVITVYRNVPYFCDNNNYLKDTGCQTDIIDFANKGIQNVKIEHALKKHENEYGGIDMINKPPNKNFEDISTYETFEQIKPVIESSPVDKDEDKSIDEASNPFPVHINYVKTELPEITNVKPDDGGQIKAVSLEKKSSRKTCEQEQIDEICPSKANFSFLSEISSKDDWSDVLTETMKTVKKVEEYIYDDYETFNKEDYNQITSKNNSSIFDKISKFGWSYTPKDSSKTALSNKSKKKQDESELYFHHTYFKFEDVFEEDGSFKLNEEESISVGSSSKIDGNEKTLKNNLSRTPLCDKAICGKEDRKTEDVPKNKKTFSLKRFKINLDFLRVMTPKKMVRHTPSYDGVGSKVKYKKIKNVKSTTF